MLGGNPIAFVRESLHSVRMSSGGAAVNNEMPLDFARRLDGDVRF